MLEKIAKIIGKMNSTVILAVALGIVAVVFIVGLVLSIGGDLAKFKSAAKLAISKPTPATLNESAKKMPVYVRKLYKKAKQTGEKPSDVIGINDCVYNPFAASAAAKFPGMVMAAGILSVLFSFFAVYYVKDILKVGAFIYIVPLLVTVGVMVFRLLAGVISSLIKKSAVGVYNKYVDMLDKNMHGAPVVHEQDEEPVVQAAAIEEEEPAVVVAQEDEEETPVTPVTPVHNFGSFDEPDSIAVELADEEPQAEPVVEPQTVVMQPAGESEEEIRAKARAEALAAARAEAAARAAAAEQEKARAEAAARAQAAAQAAARAQAAQNAQGATAGAGSSSADAVVARIEKISQEGAPLSTMKEVALELQKERAKPENKTPETQRKLNEALATLLKAMSGANKK